MGMGQGGPESKRRYFKSRQVSPRHCWTMVWGQEWKILFLLELKIAQGSRIGSLAQ